MEMIPKAMRNGILSLLELNCYFELPLPEGRGFTVLVGKTINIFLYEKFKYIKFKGINK